VKPQLVKLFLLNGIAAMICITAFGDNNLSDKKRSSSAGKNEKIKMKESDPFCISSERKMRSILLPEFHNRKSCFVIHPYRKIYPKEHKQIGHFSSFLPPD
jgi:hypothetical protein